RAVSQLGRDKVGALIVVERAIDLREYIDTGIQIDARISSALLEQVFEHNTPLHDGAVVIRDNRIVAATCYLPLSKSTDISKNLGTRHRAGLGISEASDAIALIASEETGALSVAMDGRLIHDVTADRIRDILSDFRFSQEEKKEASSIHNLLKSWKEKRRND
ncbi:MAG: DNA integrity scanning protein DisA nucleotide-binding domain protein, partial [Lachnospiraceae bacterium]|nr:DNA integrity scanning protein DisA nucleotide-binding domain protein [Lachnospiraceae bacterium]